MNKDKVLSLAFVAVAVPVLAYAWSQPAPGQVGSSKPLVVQAQPLDAHEVLLHVAPFFREEPPSWCAEDMACWIGSAADGRSDTEVLAAIRDDIAYSSWAYSPANVGDIDGHPDCSMDDETNVLTCADGYTTEGEG